MSTSSSKNGESYLFEFSTQFSFNSSNNDEDMIYE